MPCHDPVKAVLPHLIAYILAGYMDKGIVEEMQSPPNRTLSSSSSASIFVVTVAVFPIGADFPQQRLFLLREARELSNEPAIGVIDNLFDEASCRLGITVWGGKLFLSVS